MGTALLVHAEGVSNPAERYKTIIDRNPFGLKPPPAPPPPPTNAAPTVPSNVKLAGVTADRSGKRAWVMIQQPGAQGPKAVSWHEGQTDGEFQVLRIDEKVPYVEILQAGSPVKLTYKTHGIQASKAPAPNAGAVPAMPGAKPGQPGVTPATAGMGGGGATIVGRGGVTSTLASPAYSGQPTATGVPSMQAPGVPNAAHPIQLGADSSNIRLMPSRSLRTVADNATPPAPMVNPDVQAVLMRANQIEAERRGVVLPPLPPLPGEMAPPPLPGQ